MFIVDHEHIRVMDDHAHALSTGDATSFALVRQLGFRVRNPRSL
jgi:hypothetical protein